MLHDSLADPCGVIEMHADPWWGVGSFYHWLHTCSVVDLAGMLLKIPGLWLLAIEIRKSIVLMWLFYTIAIPTMLSI